MHLSTIKDFTHAALLQLPNKYKWMRENPDKTHVINANDENTFEKVYFGKVEKYF